MKLLMKTIIISTILMALCLTTFFLPDTKIISTSFSPGGKWASRIRLELYGTFGGAYCSVLIRPNDSWIGKSQEQKVFTMVCDSDEPKTQWNNENNLTIYFPSLDRDDSGKYKWFSSP